MVPGFEGFSFAPVLDAFIGVIQHLPGHLQQHQFPEPRHENGPDHFEAVERPFTDLLQAFVTLVACFLIFGICADCNQGRIGQQFLAFLIKQVLVECLENMDEGVRQHRVFNRGGANYLRVVFGPSLTLGEVSRVDGDVKQRTLHCAEECSQMLLIDEAAEVLLVGGVSQLLSQLCDEVSQRGIALERVLRIIRYVRDDFSVVRGGRRVGAKNENPAQRGAEHRHAVGVKGRGPAARPAPDLAQVIE